MADMTERQKTMQTYFNFSEIRLASKGFPGLPINKKIIRISNRVVCDEIFYKKSRILLNCVASYYHKMLLCCILAVKRKILSLSDNIVLFFYGIFESITIS